MRSAIWSVGLALVIGFGLTLSTQADEAKRPEGKGGEARGPAGKFGEKGKGAAGKFGEKGRFGGLPGKGGFGKGGFPGKGGPEGKGGPAGKGFPGKDGAGKAGEFMKKFDTNGDGKLDEDERAAIREAFKARAKKE